MLAWYHFTTIFIAPRKIPSLRKTTSDGKRRDFDLDIAVIALPHISNFADFDPLEGEPGSAAVCRSRRDGASPGSILLPGSKYTIDDLYYLRKTSLEQAILRAVSTGIIIGICGGYQMLALPSTIRSTSNQPTS